METREALKQQLYRELLAGGLKLTAPRRAILGLLLERPGQAFAAEELSTLLNTRVRGSVSRATVYRTLAMLADAGLLLRAERDGLQTFALLRSAGSRVTLIDAAAGRSVELAALPALERFIGRILPQGFRSGHAVLEVYGKFDKPVSRKAKKR